MKYLMIFVLIFINNTLMANKKCMRRCCPFTPTHFINEKKKRFSSHHKPIIHTGSFKREAFFTFIFPCKKKSEKMEFTIENGKKAH